MSGGPTPGPWVAVDGGIGAVECPPDGSNVICCEPERVMRASLAKWPENAAFIVRACNSHYELLEALEAFVAGADAGHVTVDVDSAARAAIAKARGQ